MFSKRRLLALVTVLVGVASIVGGISLYTLQDIVLEQRRQHLQVLATSQAQLIGALSHQASGQEQDPSKLSQVSALQPMTEGQRRPSQTLVLARRQGQDLELLVGDGEQATAPLPGASPLKAPLRQALAGKTGVQAIDSEGQALLVAYAPVPAAGWGLVITQGAAPLYASLARPVGMASLASLVVVAIGIWLLMRITIPLLRNLQDRERQYRSILEEAVDAIIITDQSGRCLDANSQAYQLLDYQPAELRQRTIGEFFKPPGPPLALEQLQANQPTLSEGRLQRRDGSTVEVEVNAKQLTDGRLQAIIRDATERKRAEAQLRDSEQRYREIIDNIQEIVYRARIENTGDRVWLEFISERVQETLGYAPEELTGDPEAWQRLVHPDDIPMLLATKQDLVHHPRIMTREFRGRHKTTGAYHWLEDKLVPQLNAAGQVITIFGVARDITLRKHAEDERRKLSSALEQTGDAVFITDRHGLIEYVNPAFERMTGFRREEVLGQTPRILKSGMQSAEFYERLWQTITNGATFNEVFINRRKDDTLYHEEKTLAPLRNEQGEITHFVSTGRDITQRMEIQKQLERLAHHDPLTELPNRTLFTDRLKQAMALGRRYHRLVAVMFLDLDDFKQINDTMGHEAGDLLLRTIAQRLIGCVRERDTVSRLAGDEFAVILEEVLSAKDVPPIADKILESVGQPLLMEGQSLRISASIGISLFPYDGEDSQTLLHHADKAMYQAKQQGRRRFRFYSQTHTHQGPTRQALEHNLRQAMQNNEFALYYQPQVDARNGNLVGAESLLRWHHPELGMVSPKRCIPLLEDTGLILQVEEWVLQHACAQAQAWHAKGLPLMAVGVNLSAPQFRRRDLVDVVRHVLQDTGQPAHALQLEITEGMLLHDVEATMETLRTLHAMGVNLCIDDFGTGYSSLSYLKRLPLHALKIDCSFIQDITTDSDSHAIVQAVIALSRSLRLKVVAEGVETEAQAAILRDQGCDELQGYLYSRPLPAAAFEQWLYDHQQGIAKN